MSIIQNISDLRKRISLACAKAGRDPASITVIAVSKGRVVEQIREVVTSGIVDIGENKVQEALVKNQQLTGLEVSRSQGLKVCLHMVGHLQSNKVREAVQIFDLIHSVDSIHLAQEIDKHAAKINKVQDILLEVKTSLEVTKSGLKPEDVIEAVRQISELKNIRIMGLMTIAPPVDNPEEARQYFKQLIELRDELLKMRLGDFETLRHLSMGMTNDFEVAIEEGATMVRIGRAIFGG